MPRPETQLQSTPIIRKLYTPGKGFALGIPSKWVKANLAPDNLHVTVTFADDGSFTVRPLKLPNPKPPGLRSFDRLNR